MRRTRKIKALTFQSKNDKNFCVRAENERFPGCENSKRMNTINKIITILICIAAFSCGIIMETDLSDENVTLIAPADCTITTVQTHTFWWDYLADALKYNLQIVSPDFRSTLRLVADTNLSGNTFISTLAPGSYEWRVTAYNESSYSDCDTFRLYIDTLSGLSNQYVVLTSPLNNSYLNKTDIQFGWQPLVGATSYILEIRDSTWNYNQTIFSTPWLSETNYSYNNFQEGVYSWGVFAYDASSNTNSNVSTAVFTIDKTAPEEPTFTSPANGDTLDTSPYNLEWTHPLASLASITDSLVISSDSLFNDPDIYILNTTVFSLSSMEDGKYFAKVKSFDAAGNQGGYSQPRKFFLVKEE